MTRYGFQAVQESGESLEVVSVLSAMNRSQKVFPFAQPARKRDAGRERRAFDSQIEHDIPDNTRTGTQPLASKVRHSCLRWAEEKICQLVRENAIQLLRHVSVERPDSCLDVIDRYSELGCRECCCQCRIRVSVNQNAIW